MPIYAKATPKIPDVSGWSLPTKVANPFQVAKDTSDQETWAKYDSERTKRGPMGIMSDINTKAKAAQKSAVPAPVPAPAAMSPIPGIDVNQLQGLTDFLRTQRNQDVSGGMDFANKYFGANNPEMAKILAQRNELAFGPDRQTELARQSGMEGINRQVQTALRQFQGRLPSSGVRGGAAGAMAGLLTREAVGQTRGLERDLAINEMERRRQALGELERSVTGERAGLLGTTFGMAGLGSQDRFGGMQYLTGQNWIDAARDAVSNAANPLGGGGGGGLGGALGGAFGPQGLVMGPEASSNYLYNMVAGLPQVGKTLVTPEAYDPATHLRKPGSWRA